MSRIFIISKHLMFSYGLESLLLQQPGADVVGRETNLKVALALIKELQPEIIIIDSGELPLEIMSSLTQVLNGRSGVKVIHTNLQNNQLYVYEISHTQVHGVEDLIQAIRA